jgi:hypothetical protein
LRLPSLSLPTLPITIEGTFERAMQRHTRRSERLRTRSERRDHALPPPKGLTQVPRRKPVPAVRVLTDLLEDSEGTPFLDRYPYWSLWVLLKCIKQRDKSCHLPATREDCVKQVSDLWRERGGALGKASTN